MRSGGWFEQWGVPLLVLAAVLLLMSQCVPGGIF